MKNKVILFFTLSIIMVGLFLGIGIRTHQTVEEKPINLKLTEANS